MVPDPGPGGTVDPGNEIQRALGGSVKSGLAVSVAARLSVTLTAGAVSGPLFTATMLKARLPDGGGKPGPAVPHLQLRYGADVDSVGACGIPVLPHSPWGGYTVPL